MFCPSEELKLCKLFSLSFREVKLCIVVVYIPGYMLARDLISMKCIFSWVFGMHLAIVVDI